ncbi:MAG: relaxase/mobilization nuclease domain-containing protein [Oscillospiraceae bacterium]|nr:relaxase/mobilization nuclease domain-containing protein [Oscillospiraceae bacterium]
MAIITIKPIHGQVGLKRAQDYIKDKDKTIQADILESPGALKKDELAAVLKYAANEKKTKKIYISGYLCDPDLAEEQFMLTRQKNLNRVGKIVDENGDIVGYHIIQSFPENLDISDEEVHQCGRELAEKLGLYEAVICSHLHPEIKEDGLLHGKCKHNHIIINAYCKDPEKQYGKGTRKIKYHSCRASYAELQKFNDEISVAHGLPIILNPDIDRKNSWKEAVETKSGNSWKENIRRDIDNMKRVCHTWDDYISGMKAAGYTITQNKYVTYTTPDGEHKVRDKTLGREYTKKTLERYWTPLEDIKDTSQIVSEELQKLSYETAKNGENLYVKIVKNNETLNQNNYSFNIPLNQKIDRKETYNSYFDVDKFYRIFDENNKKIMTVSGRTLRLYFEQKNVQTRQKEQEYTIKGRYFYNDTWTDHKNKHPYRIGLYDSNGHRRSLIELTLLLAIKIINDKQKSSYPSGKASVYIRTDWKLQNMINAVTIARAQNVRTDTELTEKLNIAGKSCSQLKAKIRKNDSVYNQLSTLDKTLSEFLSVRDFCEQMKGISISGETDEKKKEYNDKIEIYKRTKAVLYKYNLTSDESIADFKIRFKHSEELKQRLSDKYSNAAQKYRDLKKLQHQIDAAKDKQYVYEKEEIREDVQREERQEQSRSNAEK